MGLINVLMLTPSQNWLTSCCLQLKLCHFYHWNTPAATAHIIERDYFISAEITHQHRLETVGYRHY